MEMIQMPGLGLVHAAGCDHEACAEIPSWLHHGQYSDCCLQVQKSRLALRTLSLQGARLAKKGSGRIDMGSRRMQVQCRGLWGRTNWSLLEKNGFLPIVEMANSRIWTPKAMAW
jgi:hypothetical protein